MGLKQVPPVQQKHDHLTPALERTRVAVELAQTALESRVTLHIADVAAILSGFADNRPGVRRELTIGVTRHNDTGEFGVMLDYGHLVRSVTFDPRQARDFAALIEQMADRADEAALQP